MYPLFNNSKIDEEFYSITRILTRIHNNNRIKIN